MTDQPLTASPVDPEALIALEAELIALLGEKEVSSDPRSRQRASLDESTMSPVLRVKLPSFPADLVATPRTAAEIAQTVAAAVRHGVPVTVRGRGTGNYGQAVPLHGGVVVDTSQATAILDLSEGSITVEAGARMIDLERAANAAGQQLWMYPSTVQSTIGGFIAGGSGGTGSVQRGWVESGFVQALDVVHADGTDRIHHIEGAENLLPYIHTYGTTGVIVAATVSLEPMLDWVSVWSTVPDFPTAQRALMAVAEFEPAPRIASTDMGIVNESFPQNLPLTRGVPSLRAVITREQLPAFEVLVASTGGSVEEVREGLPSIAAISLLSYNHPLWHMIRANERPYFHIETGGMGLVDNLDEILTLIPEAVMHLDASRPFPIGMVGGLYESEEKLAWVVQRLGELDVFAHSPHSWVLDRRPDVALAAAAVNDPQGLLNPGKLPEDSTVSRDIRYEGGPRVPSAG